MKGNKNDEYHYLTKAKFVSEMTPNGHSFAISADTFCEV
jgi:hypothetical protein